MPEQQRLANLSHQHLCHPIWPKLRSWMLKLMRKLRLKSQHGQEVLPITNWGTVTIPVHHMRGIWWQNDKDLPLMRTPTHLRMSFLSLRERNWLKAFREGLNMNLAWLRVQLHMRKLLPVLDSHERSGRRLKAIKNLVTVKWWLREHCDYTFKTLQGNPPKAMASISTGMIQKWQHCLFRWMVAYWVGLSARDTPEHVKVYYRLAKLITIKKISHLFQRLTEMRSLRSATYSARSLCRILAVLALQQEYSQLVPGHGETVEN